MADFTFNNIFYCMILVYIFAYDIIICNNTNLILRGNINE